MGIIVKLGGLGKVEILGVLSLKEGQRQAYKQETGPWVRGVTQARDDHGNHPRVSKCAAGRGANREGNLALRTMRQMEK